MGMKNFLRVAVASSMGAGLLAPLASNAASSGYYTYFVSNNKAVVTYYSNSSVSGHLNITNTLGGYPVVEISGAFWGCADLTSVAIPLSVTTIGDWAFADCTSLTNAVIPSSVSTIGYKAFSNCALSRIVIPEGTTSIGEAAFIDCTNLRYAVISDSVTQIGPDAFSNCSSMTNAILGNGVLGIGARAFSYCTQLSGVNLPASLSHIDDYAFAGCGSLAGVIIPAGVTNVGYGAFANCTELKRVFFSGDAPSFYEPASTFADTTATIYYAPGSEGWGTVEFSGHALSQWDAVVQSGPTFGFADGLFGFTITGGPDMPLVVKACTNLASGIWEPIASTATDSSGAYGFSDATSTDKPACFYRVVWPE